MPSVTDLDCELELLSLLIRVLGEIRLVLTVEIVRVFRRGSTSDRLLARSGSPLLRCRLGLSSALAFTLHDLEGKTVHDQLRQLGLPEDSGPSFDLGRQRPY